MPIARPCTATVPHPEDRPLDLRCAPKNMSAYLRRRRGRLPLLLLALFVLTAPVAALAHGGGLDASGCHTNRRTGDYHCHRAPATSAPAAYASPMTRSQPSSPNAFAARPSEAFPNCAAARAAGAAPVRRGEPGYGPHLDRDNDGVGWE